MTEAPGVSTTSTARVVVLVPAHDEAASIGTTLRALQAQTRRPDRVVVVADNCTDDTVAIARAAGAEVVETVGNTDKKAGALNQALERRFRRSATSDRRGDTAPPPHVGATSGQGLTGGRAAGNLG